MEHVTTQCLWRFSAVQMLSHASPANLQGSSAEHILSQAMASTGSCEENELTTC